MSAKRASQGVAYVWTTTGSGKKMSASLAASPVISVLAVGLVSASLFACGSTWPDRCWLLSDVAGTERALGENCFPHLAGLLCQQAVVEVPKRFLALSFSERAERRFDLMTPG